MKEKIISTIPEALRVTRAIDPEEDKFIVIPHKINAAFIGRDYYAKTEANNTSNLTFVNKSNIPEYSGIEDPNWEDGMMVGLPRNLKEYRRNQHSFKEYRLLDDEDLLFTFVHEDGFKEFLNKLKIKIYRGVEGLLGKEKIKSFKDIWDAL